MRLKARLQRGPPTSTHRELKTWPRRVITGKEVCVSSAAPPWTQRIATQRARERESERVARRSLRKVSSAGYFEAFVREKANPLSASGRARALERERERKSESYLYKPRAVLTEPAFLSLCVAGAEVSRGCAEPRAAGRRVGRPCAPCAADSRD